LAPLTKVIDIKDSNSKAINNLMDYGNNKINSNFIDYNSNQAYLENLNNYQSNNYNNLKPIENKKLFLKYSGNNDAQPKKIFEKDYLPKENKYDLLSDDIEEDIMKEPLPGLTKPYLRDPIRDMNEENRINNLKKFNVKFPIEKNYDRITNNILGNNLLNRERENLGIRKKNFMDSEKDILGIIKNNLERDIDMRPNAIIKNRDYSLNDNYLHRNYQINALNSNNKDKGYLNLNLNNINNYNNNYNPVMTNLNNNNKEIKYLIPSRNFDNTKKEKKDLDSIFNKNDNFNLSKKKWEFDSNNNYDNKKADNFVYNSRRKLNPLNKRSKLNEQDLYGGILEITERNNNSNINNLPINEDKGIKFESRRQHLLQKI
jgi:hypothetical protein